MRWPAEMRAAYDELSDLLNESYTNGPLSTETDGDRIDELEGELIQQVADAHGMTADDVRTINAYGSMGGYLYNFDTSALKLNTGDLQEANINGTTLIVKAKIEPSFSNKATIDQNYYNVADLIKNQDCDVFSEVQYWAVADMQSGDEGKVISFDVPKELIGKIKEGSVVDNQLGDYVENLWVLPSLQS